MKTNLKFSMTGQVVKMTFKYSCLLNRGAHMDRFDCNIIVMFVLGVLNRGGHMDKFDCNIIVVFYCLF